MSLIPKTEITLYGELTIYSPEGTKTYQGKPDGYPVDSASVTSDGNVVVLLKSAEKKYGAFNNLLLLRSDGAVIWRAELPYASSSDAYVDFRLSNEKLLANSWSGHRVQIDLGDGKLLARTFTK